MTETDQPQNDSAHADIGIVAALPMELAPFLDRCDRVKKYTGGKFVFRGGRYDDIRIAVVESGMGFARARRATQALIEAHTPRWVLSCGFAGALSPSMKVGNIVIADSIIDTHGHELTVDLKMSADPKKGLHVGRLVSADEMVRTIVEKEKLATDFDAIAVDMETLAVAQVCRDENIRFLSVRTISDDMSADLPPEVLTLVGSTGTQRIGAAIGSLWKRPSSIKEIWHLREQAHLAAERLATFLDGIVKQLYQSEH